MKDDEIVADCSVTFSPGEEFLNVRSVMCDRVGKVVLDDRQNILKLNYCESIIRQDNITDFSLARALDLSLHRNDDKEISTNTGRSLEPETLAFGFGTMQNIIFFSIMIVIVILLSAIILRKHLVRNNQRITKKGSTKHVEKRIVCREIPGERTL